MVGAAVTAALAFPASSAGGAAMLIVAGALGIAVVEIGKRIPGDWKPSSNLAGASAIGVVAFGSAAVFKRVIYDPIGWTMGDWGVQRAVLSSVISGMHHGHIPVWSHALSTGDAPLETYPAMTYLISAALAIGTGSEGHLALFLLIFGIVVHTLVAVGITRLCLRVAPAPVAAIAGLTQIVDVGGISAGGLAGNLEWALVHNALGQAFALCAVTSVVAAVEQPRLRTSVSIWIWTALAAATHPSALLFLGAVMVALGVVAFVATDVPARRPLAAAGHLALGLALAAVVWMPLGERLILYGQHFPGPPHVASEWFRALVRSPVPATTFAPLMYVGYLGLVGGLLSRRAVPALIGATGILLLLGLVDTPYLVLHVGPSQALARLGAERFGALCRPFVIAGGAWTIALGLRLAARSGRNAGPGAKRGVAAAVAVGALLGLRAVIPFAADRSANAVAVTERAIDSDGQAELEEWAAKQMAALPPGAYARALFDIGDVHYNYHLTAATGLPGFHMGATANLLLRERIEDTSPESLRRFNVRWVIIADDADAPPRTDLMEWERPSRTHTSVTLALGDPSTELRFGRYVIREVPGWDGAFARVERGTGEVRVVRLENERVEIELTGSDRPALVALGIGFYPRWRAQDSSGRELPVYALPSKPGGELRVVAAWVRPGKTVFTVDGALPSDGKGRSIAFLAAICAVATIICWSRRDLRTRILRRVACAHVGLGRRRNLVRAGAGVLMGVALLIAGAVRLLGPAKNVEVGLGLRSVATVKARIKGEGPYRDCGYSVLEARYTCAGIAAVYDVVSNVVNDAQARWPEHVATWPFVTPAIAIDPVSANGVEVQITASARLAGTYWIAAVGGATTVRIHDDAPMVVSNQIERTLPDRGDVAVNIDARLSGAASRLVVVRRDAVEPERSFLVAPPEAPPF